MPRISAFSGIVIWMYYDEPQHRGRAHFHARHGDEHATVDIERPAIIAGRLSFNVERTVLAWAEARREQLSENWIRAARHDALAPVEPPR